ncbi:MAG: alpha/beta hydrolase [Proteobacteria bacterium]|nr:alpha/beta hydrolase [Pseudomonadota bacterium]
MKIKTLAFQTQLLLLLFLCTSCAQVAKNSDTLRAAKAPAQYGVDRFTTEQKHNAHYVEVGEGPPAILIPGLFGTYRGFSRMLPFLAPHFSLIALDNFGTGDSDMPDENFGYTVAEQADMIVKLMDELKIPHCTLIGVSYGGMIALNIAARYPKRVNAVVCIEGAVIMPKPSPYLFMEQGLNTPIIGDAIIGFIRSGLLDTIIAEDVMGHAWPNMGAGDKAEIKKIISHYTDAASRPTWLSLARALRTSQDFTEEAKVITAPVLYLSGDKSSFREMTETNIDYFRNHLPNVSLVSFDDGIHDLELQKPRETASMIIDFLTTEHSRALASTAIVQDGPKPPPSLPSTSQIGHPIGTYQ